MTRELRKKIKLLAYLMQNATESNRDEYFELENWFFNYRQSATPEQQLELSKEMQKLYPKIQNGVVELMEQSLNTTHIRKCSKS